MSKRGGSHLHTQFNDGGATGGGAANSGAGFKRLTWYQKCIEIAIQRGFKHTHGRKGVDFAVGKHGTRHGGCRAAVAQVGGGDVARNGVSRDVEGVGAKGH